MEGGGGRVGGVGVGEGSKSGLRGPRRHSLFDQLCWCYVDRSFQRRSVVCHDL